MSLDNRRLALNVHRSASSPLPTVHIFLQRVVRQANGMLAVTPVCSSLPEIEGEIEDLRSELEDRSCDRPGRRTPRRSASAVRA